ncbi:MAG TPA: GNAT family N-acetyltransferase, partial [Ktedonobacteraceae bacterium]|nr:GNAT family N-acetyltransferase [Ktedonobacteraceae bacterium]
MSPPSIIVRPLTTAEYELHFQSANAELSPDPSPASALLIQNLTISRPESLAEQLRGAFLDGKQVGSYILHERLLRMGAARLPMGCVGSVVTYSGYRNQGIATAMMHDAIN